MASVHGYSLFQFFSMIFLITSVNGFSIKEATVHDLQLAFKRNQLTSKQLVEFYLIQIQIQNPVLKGVLEVNPDAVAEAERADKERKKAKETGYLLSGLHGIPILVKDNIASKDKLNTTAGSYALLGSVVPRDAGVVSRLRKAGAIILGKASLSEWSYFRSNGAPSGWSARGGQGKNPYTLGDPCGSSSGSAISVAANLVTVSLGTETDGSILCPSNSNSVVGIKPTVGLTSRSGVVPISPRQDTVGPICRTVSDAALVLETIAGIDAFDKETIEASKYIPKGGYTQYLKKDGLRGKRLGIVRSYYDFGDDTFLDETFKLHLKTLRQRGAVLVDHLKIDNIDEIFSDSSESIALDFEFKLSLNAYLKDLVASPVRSLADVIAYNKKHPKLEKLDEYGQDVMLQAEKTNGIGKVQEQALLNLTRLSQNGFEKLMKRNKLDAVVIPSYSFSNILAIGGYPGVIVPAGYEKGVPFGICFGGLKGSEPKLIEIAYSFEQATMIRKPPPLRKLKLKNINRLDRLMRLKEILVRQDEMSAELTNSILTYLQEIIINFSDDPPLLGEEALKKWNEVTYSLTNLSFMEAVDAVLLPMRSKAEQFREGNKPTKQVRPAELNFGPVYNLWVKPPQLRSGLQCETIRLSPRASRTSPEFHC